MRTAAIAAAMLAAWAAPALAHHSFSMFDHEKTVSVTGTVKEFEFANPHAWIHLMAADASGKPVEWDFEMGSVGQIVAQGWKRDSIKPGDKLTVEMHPLKDGTHGGQYVAAILPDGKRLFNAGNANGANVIR
jgi:Family of unknown function (DUF6152)